MSSSPTAAMDSRSSSPATPDSPDGIHPVAIHHDNEFSSWYHSLRPGKSFPELSAWDEASHCLAVAKSEEERMLQLDDLIDEHAYDEYDSRPSLSGMEALFPHTRPFATGIKSQSNGHAPAPQTPAPTAPLMESDFMVSSQGQVSCTKPIPPPAVRPRKRDPSTTPHRVVYPAKDSCHNLSIMTPNIPESGTKSRVETQVRVTIDLAHGSSSSGEAFKYDRVGTWKWLKLPPGTSTKKRTRKEGKIDPAPLDILHLTAAVTCASPPFSRVVSCASCQAREAKRVAKKLAARVRPARSDSDSPEDGADHPKGSKEDTTSIIQFNCPEVLDFASGSAVLPVRITCYCRHHREKIGFHVHFTMMDHSGRVIGTGTSPPIMITDDHKSTQKQGVSGFPDEVDWSQYIQAGEPVEPCAPSKRKTQNKKGQSKKRPKPYDAASRSNSARFSREASVGSFSSPVNSPSTVPNTRSPTPSHPPHSLASIQPLSQIEFADINMLGPPEAKDIASSSADQLSSPVSGTLASPIPTPVPPSADLMSDLVPSQAMPFMFFNPGSPSMTSVPLPKIHRLIPASGPTHGGIEVTVLGENFHPAVQLNCIFGDAVASFTQRWSDNTLVCVLPPRSSPGVVAVWFEGVEKDNTLPSLFTYTDESDRALMELALQVVGLKMTGKIEDAKNVALRIVGTTGTEDSQSRPEASTAMQVASSSPSFRDIRPLLLIRTGEETDYESVIVKFLNMLDVAVDNKSDIPMSAAISHTTTSGQTLLHLAAFLGFSTLVEFLLRHNIDLDVRDRNGYTALHFAVTARSKACVKLLVDAGADLEIVNVLGKTPEEIAPTGFFADIISSESEQSYEADDDDDGESRWGDVETEDETHEVTVKRRVTDRISRRRVDDSSQQAERKQTPEIPRMDTSQGDLDTSSDIKKPKDVEGDEKHTASFVDMIQRTLAQLHAPQGIIPNMPQLPLPHLPEMPTVPWAALPQIPMVFPVFVPMPAWPSFLTDKRDEQQEYIQGEDAVRPTGSATMRAAQEWRATWEKWTALAIATATMRQQQNVEEAPPMYTPRENSEDDQPSQQHASSSVSDGEASNPPNRPSNTADRPSRRVGYENLQIADQEVNAYGYRPTKAQSQKLKKKHDRMLVLFWLPILLISLLWALHNGVRFALQAIKTTLSLRSGVHA
ncbi:hypothetical protein SERLA73DRAFT_107088 [Serpula lacrymans var. lacrymans S7.3]|uniref:IPT/TIG domain-containing protein n=1 Tax=Serpula lacrymans var. lacrymans (strain S7.3) TaxID=936435 RepID=F8PV27_SERL3|nr:hypothetical protein SERLA73DRAFT_107088 [Serpula lacrymans var. lacrymans S7.3]